MPQVATGKIPMLNSLGTMVVAALTTFQALGGILCQEHGRAYFINPHFK
jgi:hypothetical protein